MLLIVAATDARWRDPDGFKVPRLLTGRIKGLRRSENDPCVLGGGHLHIAGGPGSIPWTIDRVRSQRTTGLGNGIDLAEHAGETEAHRWCLLRNARCRDEEYVLERPPAQMHKLAGDAEQLDEPEPTSPEVHRRRQIARGDRHERGH